MRSDIADKQQAIFCMLARFGEAMSSPKRLKIISLLSEGPKSVEQLADLTDQSTAATSAHLELLRASGLVEGDKEGRHGWGILAGATVKPVWHAVRNPGDELDAADRGDVRDYYEHGEPP